MLDYIFKYLGIFATTILILAIIFDISGDVKTLQNSKYYGALICYAWLSIMGYIASFRIELKEKDKT